MPRQSKEGGSNNVQKSLTLRMEAVRKRGQGKESFLELDGNGSIVTGQRRVRENISWGGEERSFL